MPLKLPMLLWLAMLTGAYLWMAEQNRPAWSPRVGGWRKLLGGVAFILALLVVLNPEFLALGLLGDSAFFDLLVLLLGLQLQTFITRGWHGVRTVAWRIHRVLCWRLARNFALMVFFFAPVAELFSVIQKAVHRISS